MNRASAALVAAVLCAIAPLAAQDNVCGVGEAPDIVVTDIFGGQYWGTVGGISAYSFGTDACNLGTCQANWFANTAAHPVIAQNLFRLRDGRFQQIGQSWVKHTFSAADGPFCSATCLPANEEVYLGVNCSDAYGSGLNANQLRLGPKSEVQARTGVFPWPPTALGVAGDNIYKRLQVHDTDIDPAQNQGASYFVEVQYVAQDDAAGNHQNNNVSHVAANVSVASDGSFAIAVTGDVFIGAPAILAWQAADPEVLIAGLDQRGQYYLGSRVTDLGGGRWHYEYAVENVDADGAAKFSVPVNGGASVTNATFRDVDYHSGEPFDGTDWPAVFDAARGALSWAPVTPDELANALRWGTLYNFAFDVDQPPEIGPVTLEPYVPEPPGTAADKSSVQLWIPRACDSDGLCEPVETCNNCPSDCPGVATSGFCGDGICDPPSAEDCLSCPSDCRGQLGGNPSNRFCCGGGAGQTRVDCDDPRCNASGFVCASPCCGDGFCDFGEGSCNCAFDCGAPEPLETACSGGVDEDCDDQVDCADVDCCLQAGCADGIDGDGDSVADCDCDDADAAVWSRPGEVRGVFVAHDAASGTSTITWSAPLDPGASVLTYEVLRATSPSDFVVAACLVLPDPHVAAVAETAVPPPGATLHYLVRAANACPGGVGLGPLGSSSSGTPRAARSCP